MPCDQDRDGLASYFDGGATADQAKSLEEHIRTCPDCAREVAAMVRLRRALKPAASRFIPSAQFRQKVQAQISPRRTVRYWLWPAAALTLAVMILALVSIDQSSRRSETFREVADLHISDLASANPYDVVSSDRHTVKPWFQGKTPFAFNLPEFGGTDFALLGARLVYLDQQPTAQIVVGFRQHKISVLVLKETSALGVALSFPGGAAVRDSFNVETWQREGLRFFVIGDADKQVIEQLGQILERANP